MQSFKNNILILFAHPALQNSRVNSQLIDYVKDLDGITFHDLYETYPDFYIDVKHEQNLLLGNDIIVFHHPLFWFSIPAILSSSQISLKLRSRSDSCPLTVTSPSRDINHM